MVSKIQFPTHELQNTLDIAISSAQSTLLSHFRQHGQISHHNIGHFKLENSEGVLSRIWDHLDK